MTLIKKATLYRAKGLGTASSLENHLRDHKHVPPLSTERQSSGFVPPFDNEDQNMVVDFPGGFVFCLQVDSKSIPGSAVATEVKKRIKEYLEASGRKHAGKAVKADIKQQVVHDLCTTAPIRTALINVFFHEATSFLFVTSTSSRVTDTLISTLVAAVGTIQVESVAFENSRVNLATRLQNYMPSDADADGDNMAFDGFEPGGEVVLKDVNGQKISFKLSAINNSSEAVVESLRSGFGVETIQLGSDAGWFKLAANSTIHSIDIAKSDDDGDEEPDLVQNAAWETANFAQMMTELCALFVDSSTSTANGTDGAEEGAEVESD